MTNLTYKKPLIFGNIRDDNINGKYKFYNSAFYINNGKIEFYDKIHLVPFGEYFPLQNIFKPVKYYFFGDSDAFSRGSIIKNFTYKDISISPLICYEGAFVDLVQEAVKKNNDVFVILTNDSWFGNSIGRYQHLAISVIRAVETGKFVIRAAQSGISACIGPDGKIDNFLDIDKSDIIECNLRIQKRTTVFNTVQYLWIFLSLIIIVFNYSVKRFYKLHKQPHKT
jgi:apolipoprotein N-acyltransferase